jgi:hypothetical protein
MTLCKYSLCLVAVGLVAGCVTAQPSTGTAALSWTRPIKNTNGSPLLNLAGYRIHYGARPDALSQSIAVSDPATTSYTLQGLASGTWYFAISAFTTAGTSSTLSAVVSKTIQ